MTHRVVFLGSPDFAVPSLDELCNDPRFDVVMVISQPDRRAGRGRKLTPPPVAEYASQHNLLLFQPESMRDPEAIAQLAEMQPDLLVVVAYGEILNRQVLNLAKRGAINVHPSLLPRYRGAAPIQAAILNGDPHTGVSIMKLVRRLDAGPVLAQVTQSVRPDDTAGTLSERLAQVTAGRLPDVADSWIAGSIEATTQDDASATYTREWTKEDARIDWNLPASRIERLVRASLPWPVAWTTVDEQRIQVREARLSDGLQIDPGSVALHDGDVVVGTSDVPLQLVSVQPESKRPMPAADWWRSQVASAPVRFE